MRINEKLFKYELSASILYGVDAVERMGEEIASLGIQKVLIATDPGVREACLIEPIEESLKNADIDYVIYDDVKPSTEVVEGATQTLKKNNCELVIGVGGGSSMDTAKAVAAMATNDGSIMDYAGLENLNEEPLPIVAVPTTAGTGSEATIWAVISDEKNDIKTGIGSKMMMPNLAVCDPKLTLSLPPHITAATGMDALTHAIESYVNTATQPISEAMAEKSIKLISDNLRAAVANGENIEARDGMLMGSLMAALAFNETRLGIAHSWSTPLGAYYPISHGDANAILLPNVMEFNLIGNVDKFIKIAEIMGENTSGLTPMGSAKKSVTAVRNLMEDINLPMHLSDVVDIDEDSIPEMAETAFQSGNNLVNPRKPDLEDMIQVFKNSL